MITVKNRLFPWFGCTAMTVWPFVFVRSEKEDHYGPVAERHEQIHAHQQLEVLVITVMLLSVLALHGGAPWWSLAVSPFVYFVLYALEWLVRLAIYRDRDEAYRNVSFEQEAYLHQDDTDYLTERRSLFWLGYLPLKTYHKKK